MSNVAQAEVQGGAQSGVRALRAVPAQMAVRTPRPTPTQPLPVQPTQAQAQARRRAPQSDVAWLDKAIVGVAGALAFMVFRFLFL
ncbi:hypothetical protein BDZ85DRAFT_258127 [Elsinoe ampelina]|uniref:Uncharacterized protein n=1 Tax=Elsinoe ampelina TaxID=302913 RepID=A0A6A6GJG2_9PEZI|nr:hypothetical protein BDZ85DRAFT_258127 [Elsinoe ampelina]